MKRRLKERRRANGRRNGEETMAWKKEIPRTKTERNRGIWDLGFGFVESG